MTEELGWRVKPINRLLWMMLPNRIIIIAMAKDDTNGSASLLDDLVINRVLISS